MGQAEEYLKKPLRVKELLNDAYKKASEKKEMGTIAHEVWESLQTLIRLIKAAVTGEYTGIPTSYYYWGYCRIALFFNAYWFCTRFYSGNWFAGRCGFAGLVHDQH